METDWRTHDSLSNSRLVAGLHPSRSSFILAITPGNNKNKYNELVSCCIFSLSNVFVIVFGVFDPTDAAYSKLQLATTMILVRAQQTISQSSNQTIIKATNNTQTTASNDSTWCPVQSDHTGRRQWHRRGRSSWPKNNPRGRPWQPQKQVQEFFIGWCEWMSE